jgi:predicted NAD/FAD-binding protein
MHFKIHKTEADQPYHSTIVADNGQVTYTSENYHNFTDMISTMIHTAGLNAIQITVTFEITQDQYASLVALSDNHAVELFIL